ncbi:MAG: DUF4331 family protein [Sandaracinus sp.]
MNKNWPLLLGIAVALVAGCNNPPATPTDSGSGTDTGTGTDSGADSGSTPDTGVLPDTGPLPDTGVTNDCAGYCAYEVATCTDDLAQYADVADCMAQCTALALPAGTPGATNGNSIACRIYHTSVAASSAAMAMTHCSHTGATGGGVCGALTIRTGTVDSAYVRVDRMGMPAVSTALVSSDQKDIYNDGTIQDDADLTYALDMLTSLGGIHAALDDDLTAAGLTPCLMTANNELGFAVQVPDCVAQTYGANHPVVSLVVPDTLTIDPTHASGFPNGRRLDDPVIDVTLAVLLLDIGDTNTHPRTVGGTTTATPRPAGTCGTGTCSALTFIDTATGHGTLFQSSNDATASTTFPYLAAPHAP